jgi:hypothetical protein
MILEASERAAHAAAWLGPAQRLAAVLELPFADHGSNDAKVGVTTINGVVVLTGTLATQDAIDHVKGVAEKVQVVKSVDTSALKITST